MALPAVEVSVAELDVSLQSGALLRGESDLAVGDPLPEHPRLRRTVVRQEPCAVWMSLDHPLARLDVVRLAALAGVPIANSAPHIRPAYDAWVLSTLREAGVTPTLAPPSWDTPSGISRMIEGSMVSLSPDILGDGAVPGLTSRAVSDPVRWSWVATMVRDGTSPAGHEFVAWACRAAA